MRIRWGALLVMTSKTSMPPACNRLIISHDNPVRFGRQQVRTLPYLLSSDRELDALAGLDPGLDEGANGVDGEEHDDDEDETEEEVEGGVSHLSANGLDAHIVDHAQPLEESGLTVLVVTADLAPFVGRVDDRVLKVKIQTLGSRNPDTNLEVIDELGEGDIIMVTKDVEGLEVIGVGTVPELDADKVPVIRSGAGTDFDGEGRGVIG